MNTDFKIYRKIDVYKKVYTSTRYRHGYGKFMLEYRFSTDAFKTCREAAAHGDAASSFVFDHVAKFSEVN